ncbi:hypothetical protein DFH08DRAFT_419349 [Mycena albidolilacea]|uniref:DUF6534 domain-containing protein n=1 Tax=Mycena albidolilacea TaxID=1033008 RepID=A0AAD6ZCW5_9AGAR|nr:hypothetical protein DFH08DRAFT_419349 [Mycena albidolilacea]
MPGVSAEEAVLVKWFLGPWLIGSSLELVLMGVLGCQFVNYYSWYPDDSRGLRIAVAVLCLLSVLKSAETFASLWIFLINHFGNIEYDLSLSTTGWWDTANPLMVACIDFYVQCFYLYRLWGVSKRWGVVAPIFAFFVFSMVAIGLATYFIATAQHNDVSSWFGTHLGTAFAGDAILTSTTAYFLLKTKKYTISSRTAGLLTSLVRLTFQTAAPAALVAMFNLIFSQMYRTSNPLLGYVEIAFNQPLPKLYAISMMWTLNARRAIRARNELSGSGSGSGGDCPSGVRVRSPHRTNDDLELGRIEVVKHTQTTQHVDITKMFHHSTTSENVEDGLSSGNHKMHS